MKSALSIVFGVAAVAFVAAPVTSFAGGTIAGKVTYAGKPRRRSFPSPSSPIRKFCPKNPHKELIDGDKRFCRPLKSGRWRSEERRCRGRGCRRQGLRGRLQRDGSHRRILRVSCRIPAWWSTPRTSMWKTTTRSRRSEVRPGCAPQSSQLHREGAPRRRPGSNIGLAKKGDKLDKPVTFRGGAEGRVLSSAVRPARVRAVVLPPGLEPPLRRGEGRRDVRDQGCAARQAQGPGFHPFVGKGKKTEFEVEVADNPEGSQPEG